MKYDKCKPISNYSSSCFLVEYKNKIKELWIVSPDLDIVKVIDMVKAHNGAEAKFSVTRIDVGVFKVAKTINSYSGDARKLTSGLRIKL